MSDGDNTETNVLPPDAKPIATFDTNNVITFGADETNDVVLTDEWISARHAEIKRQHEYVLVDLDSATGIYRNGQRVSSVVLKADDVFMIGRHVFIFQPSGVFKYEDVRPIVIEAYDLTVLPDNRPLLRRPREKLNPLLDDISFVVRRGALIGVIGPSGSGKSTLLKTISGIRLPAQGRLLLDKQDIDQRGDRRSIGIVPQEDILHRQLNVRRALRFAAALRCSRGVRRNERDMRINNIVDLLDLGQELDKRVETLSGGQRKRTSVAMELLSTPSLLCLDEPTSGLDPAMDREVMGALRELANAQKTVIVATHSALHLDVCDYVLVMCVGGRMTYFGPPGAELFDFFETPRRSFTDVFSKITDDPEPWAQRYRNSEIYRRYVGQEQLRLLEEEAAKRRSEASGAVGPAEPRGYRAGTYGAAAPPRSAADASAPITTSASRTTPNGQSNPDDVPPSRVRQWFTLCLRMASVIASDRRYLLLLIGLPLALAGLSHLLPGDKGLGPDPGGLSLEAERLLIILITCAALMGIAAPIREIVSEAEIYRRERAIGLSPTAYLLSKVVMFVLIDCVQVAGFVWLALLGRGRPSHALVLPNSTLEIGVAVAMVTIASSMIGLLFSALVGKVEQTTPLLVASVVAQLILSGGLFEITGRPGLEFAAWLDPSRWGFSAAAATTNLTRFPFFDPAWGHTPDNWWKPVIFLGIQVVVLVALTRLSLNRYNPGRR